MAEKFTTTKMINTTIISRQRCKQKPRWSPARGRRSPGRWGRGCHSQGQYCSSQKHEISSFTGQGSDLGDPEVCGHRPNRPRSQDCLRRQHWRLRAASGKYILVLAHHDLHPQPHGSGNLSDGQPVCLPQRSKVIWSFFSFLYTLYMSVAGSICFGLVS